jgi:hypothetical protein
MMDRWMMDYCSVFTTQPFHQKKGISFKWYRYEIEPYFLKADTGMRIRVGGVKKPINEYRSGHTVTRNTGKSQLMLMSNKWIFLSLLCPSQLIFVFRHMYIIV